MNTLDQILNQIEHFQTIVIHRHQRPDPDALGSQGGLAKILKLSFPEKNIFQVGESVADLTFLTTMDEISDAVYKDALVIVTDTANAPRISDKRYALGRYLIKIDHHPNDEPYGDLIWVNPQASSCSELIYDFYQHHQEKLQLSSEAARLLYAGIVGDTGRFLYPATTAHTLQVASELMNYNFDATKLNRELEQITIQVAKLAGYVYQNLEIDRNGAAKIVLPQQQLKSLGINDSQTAAIVALPGTIDQVLAWGIFVEQPEGDYRVRLRSKGPVINNIAKRHQGGGHPLASGASAKDEKEVTEIYTEIQQVCQEQ